MVGRRLGVGRVESVFLVCLADVDREHTPVDSAVNTSPLLLGILFSLSVLSMELCGRVAA